MQSNPRKTTGIFVPRGLRLYPYINRTEAERVRSLLMSIAESQKDLMKRAYHDLSDGPKIKPSFVGPLGTTGSQLGNRISLSARLPYIETDSEIAASANHEIGHYLQFRYNKKISVARRIIRFRETKRFTEGFAVFFERVHSGYTTKGVVRGVEQILSGQKKLKGHVDWYARGYLRFLAIAKAESVERALEVGLTGSVSDWLKVVRASCRSLGIEYV
jgi:hypothetical protein